MKEIDQKDDQLSKEFWFSIIFFDEIAVKGSTCLTFLILAL